MQADWTHGGFGIYIHWPFCQAKCPYCDFNSHVSQSIDQTRWKNAYLAELSHAAEQTKNRRVDSVFFGGGTPSLMNPSTVADIIAIIRKHWHIANDLEVTLEANPTSVEAGRFKAYAQAGVTRISMGVQALNDADLKALGRMHTAKEAKAAFDIAKAHFESVSFDLIYARQNQSVDHWKSELTEALSMAVDHLSLYQLTIEPETRFGELHKRGKLKGLPNDAVCADLYFLTQDICDAAGLSAYEISNHARAGQSCKHNLIYWRYGDYLGIGPGAHGRLTKKNKRLATETPLLPDQWINAVEQAGTATYITETLSGVDQATEYLMMSLRLSEGSDMARYTALAEKPLNQSALSEMVDSGFVEVSGSQLSTTQKGKPILNHILYKLLI